MKKKTTTSLNPLFVLALLAQMAVTTPVSAQSSSGQRSLTRTPTASPTRVPPSASRRIRSVKSEFTGIPADEFYRRLSHDLAPHMGISRKKPTKSEKVLGLVGTAAGYTCAAVAAYQFLGLDEKLKKKPPVSPPPPKQQRTT